MPCINKPLTTAQFLASVLDVSVDRMELIHQRHARAVVRLTNATSALLENLQANDLAQQWAAVAEAEAALADIREAV